MVKIQTFFVLCCVITSNMHGSITKDREQSWNILCNPELIIKVQACGYGTFFTAKKGTICDAAQNRQNMSVLLSLVIAQSIEHTRLSNNKTAFLIKTGSSNYLALIFNPEISNSIDFFDINQPRKIFPCDQSEIQELKRLIILTKTNDHR